MAEYETNDIKKWHDELKRYCSALGMDYYETMIKSLYQDWMNSCPPSSDTAILKNNEYYMEIVSMGELAVEPILKLIKVEPSLLFLALMDITGRNPVKVKNLGNIKKICKDWIKWGEESEKTNI